MDGGSEGSCWARQWAVGSPWGRKLEALLGFLDLLVRLSVWEQKIHGCRNSACHNSILFSNPLPNCYHFSSILVGRSPACWHTRRLWWNKDERFCHIVKSSEGGRSSRAPLLAPMSDSFPPACYDSNSHILPTHPHGKRWRGRKAEREA